MPERKREDLTQEGMLELQVAEAISKDVGRAIARIDPADMERLTLGVGDIITIRGKRETVAKIMPAFNDMRGKSTIQLDGISRQNAGVGVDDKVTIAPTDVVPAEKLVLAPITVAPSERDLNYIGSLLDGLPVRKGDRIRVSMFGNRAAEFKIDSLAPSPGAGAAIIHPSTHLLVGKQIGKPKVGATTLSYEDVGGLGDQVHRIREMIELPLRYPELFERLGIAAPRGVLLLGPPGCGKTLIARIIAQESDANFFTVSGPEIVHKYYGESEAHLRKIFEEASSKGPSIIFLDEIDAIAPRRDKVQGEVEKRVVAQLLALMDGLKQRQNLIVIAATNLPNALDPALRRPGRFDREIEIPIPDRNGREEILDIHSRGMPLAEDVDLKQLSGVTHGFVGADLESLCREAAMRALRRILPHVDYSRQEIPYDQLAELDVQMGDFNDALREVEPSAIREVFVEIPNVHWDDVGGLGEIKEKLVEAVEWPLNYPQLYEEAGIQPPRGLLLGGPPGVGKTLIARAVATETGVNVIPVKGPELMSQYVGESEKGVREVFHKARQAAPCIIFFDEIDALVPRRSAGGSDSHVSERVLSSILAEMDGIDIPKGVFVLGATNRVDLIDPAMLRPGRFDDVIQLSLPSVEDRQSIFEIHLKNKPVAEEIDLSPLVEESEGFNGAQIASVCQRAALRALKKLIEAHVEENRGENVVSMGKKILITQQNLIDALNEIQGEAWGDSGEPEAWDGFDDQESDEPGRKQIKGRKPSGEPG